MKSDMQGFIILPVIMLELFISIVMGTLILSFQYQQKAQARNRAKEEILNMTSMVRMLTAMPLNCNQNLVPGSIGSTLAEFNVLSAAENIRIKYPVGGADPQYNGTDFIAVGKQFPPIQIDKVFFTPLVQAQAADPNSRTSTLNIRVSDAMSAGIQTITIPFYFTLDPTGNSLTSCFSTSLVATTTETLQDSLCHIRFGSNYVFSPYDMACFLPP